MTKTPSFNFTHTSKSLFLSTKCLYLMSDSFLVQIFQVESCSVCCLEWQQTDLSHSRGTRGLLTVGRSHETRLSMWKLVLTNSIKRFSQRGKHLMPRCFGWTTANLFNFVSTSGKLLCYVRSCCPLHAADTTCWPHRPKNSDLDSASASVWLLAEGLMRKVDPKRKLFF